MNEYKRRLKLLVDKFASFNINRNISQFPIEKLANGPLDNNQIIHELEKHCGIYSPPKLSNEIIIEHLKRYSKLYHEFTTIAENEKNIDLHIYLNSLRTRNFNFLWKLVCTKMPDNIIYKEMVRNSHPSK